MRTRLTCIAAFTALTLASCASATPTHDLTLSEFAIRSRVPHIAATTSSLTVSNVGEFGHTVVIADAAGHVLQASGVVAPGAETEIPVDLPPGQYEVTCRLVIETPTGLIDHYEEGMHTRIVIDR